MAFLVHTLEVVRSGPGVGRAAFWFCLSRGEGWDELRRVGSPSRAQCVLAFFFSLTPCMRPANGREPLKKKARLTQVKIWSEQMK